MRFDSALHDRLKESREIRGWSIAQAANMIGVTARTLTDWESGRSQPRMNRLMKAAGVYGVAVIWLINGNDELDPNETARSRMDKLAARLEMAVKRSRALDGELRAIVTEMKTIRKLDAQFEALAEG